ncbi:MAG: hypothetical protein R2830_23520 [Saprospiraceae bacterium]
MNFQQGRLYLEDLFRENNFIQYVEKHEKHAVQKVVETCKNGSHISISFPGYKAKISGGKIVYDFRVDIAKSGVHTALSHSNIIVDIYNKTACGKMDEKQLMRALLEFAEHGNIDADKLKKTLVYAPIAPNSDILKKAEQAHLELKKKYNRPGNNFDLTVEELFKSLKWIVLQEDINYPISLNYEGRRMPFARYIEAVYSAKKDGHDLGEVIKRALSHTRPKPWPEIDYSFLAKIK